MSTVTQALAAEGMKNGMKQLRAAERAACRASFWLRYCDSNRYSYSARAAALILELRTLRERIEKAHNRSLKRSK